MFQVKVIIETQTVSKLSPRVSNFFKFHHCSNDVTHQMVIRSKVKRLCMDPVLKVLEAKIDLVLDSAQKYVAHMLACRERMGIHDGIAEVHEQINSTVGVVRAMVGKRDSVSDVDVIHTIIFACVFSFSQDLSHDVKERMEIQIRC